MPQTSTIPLGPRRFPTPQADSLGERGPSRAQAAPRIAAYGPGLPHLAHQGKPLGRRRVAAMLIGVPVGVAANAALPEGAMGDALSPMGALPPLWEVANEFGMAYEAWAMRRNEMAEAGPSGGNATLDAVEWGAWRRVEAAWGALRRRVGQERRGEG